MHSFQEFWTSKRFRNKLLHEKKVHAYIFSTCLTNLSQVQLAKGNEKATCYPVDGPGDFGWCTVEQDVEEVRCLFSKKRISHNCEILTELGLLQLPLPHQGASPQHQVDGSKDQSSLPKRVINCNKLCVKDQVCFRPRIMITSKKAPEAKAIPTLNEFTIQPCENGDQ